MVVQSGAGRSVAAPERVATGIEGLDTVLGGGLPEGFMYAVQGEPGVGKTTVGLHFLRAGSEQGERVLYLTLSHTAAELGVIALSHGWSIDRIPIHEFSAIEASDQLAREQTVFSPDEIGYGELADTLVDAIDRHAPRRVVIDSVEQLRLLSDRPQHYRRQLLLITRALRAIEPCTTLFLGDMPSATSDRELEGLVHGVIELERRSTPTGAVVRRLQVTKGRGMLYADGHHTFRITTGGFEVYPRVATRARSGYDAWQPAPSSSASLDRLLGGGLVHGSACLFQGGPGTGKSSLVTTFTASAAARGERVAVFLTDERPETFAHRAKALGLDLAPHLERGNLRLVSFRPAQHGPGDIVHALRGAVDDHGASLIALDSLTSFLTPPFDASTLIGQLAELLDELGDRGALTLLTMSDPWPSATGAHAGDLGHLADTVLLLRHLEQQGRLKRAIAVVKRRHGAHDDAVRELHISERGVEVGAGLDAHASGSESAARERGPAGNSVATLVRHGDDR